MSPKQSPSHRATLTVPHGETYVVADIRPTGRARGLRGSCKYCYRTHKSWWLMPPEEYEFGAPENEPDKRALLCGYCEHVSMACFMDVLDEEIKA